MTTASDSRKLWVLMVTAFIDMVGLLMVIPLLPFYAKSLGQGGLIVGMLVSSFAVAQLLSAPMWGRFSDAYGRRLSLSNIGYHPDGGHISDDENRVARAAADILARSDLALHDRPAYRGVDRSRGIDRTPLLELGNFLIRLA